MTAARATATAGPLGPADDPGEAEYITLGRLALTGIARARALSRRGARRPEARADRGVHELGPPRLRGRGDGVVEIVYELHPDRLVVEVADDGEGFEPPASRRRARPRSAARRAARRGKRVLHLSATAFGGGVSEILYTLVPLMRDVGLEVEWQVIYGREEFFNARS
jgi:hypothetical protein